MYKKTRSNLLVVLAFSLIFLSGLFAENSLLAEENSEKAPKIEYILPKTLPTFQNNHIFVIGSNFKKYSTDVRIGDISATEVKVYSSEVLIADFGNSLSQGTYTLEVETDEGKTSVPGGVVGTQPGSFEDLEVISTNHIKTLLHSAILSMCKIERHYALEIKNCSNPSYSEILYDKAIEILEEIKTDFEKIIQKSVENSILVAPYFNPDDKQLKELKEKLNKECSNSKKSVGYEKESINKNLRFIKWGLAGGKKKGAGKAKAFSKWRTCVNKLLKDQNQKIIPKKLKLDPKKKNGYIYVGDINNLSFEGIAKVVKYLVIKFRKKGYNVILRAGKTSTKNNLKKDLNNKKIKAFAFVGHGYPGQIDLAHDPDRKPSGKFITCLNSASDIRDILKKKNPKLDLVAIFSCKSALADENGRTLAEVLVEKPKKQALVFKGSMHVNQMIRTSKELNDECDPTKVEKETTKEAIINTAKETANKVADWVRDKVWGE